MKKYLRAILFILPIFMALICMIIVLKNDNQSSMPIPLKLSFEGKYSYDEISWNTYSAKSKMSSYDGDIVVKGHFNYEIEEGSMLNFLSNHIGITVSLNGDCIYKNVVAEVVEIGQELTPSMCGKKWDGVVCPGITTEDEIELRMTNPHGFGNGSAYREVLETCYITSSDREILTNYLKPFNKLFEILGYGVLIVALMVIGISFASVLLKKAMGDKLFKYGLVALFGGGFIIFDVMIVYLMNELLVLKTYGGFLCMVLAVYYAGVVVKETLLDQCEKVARLILNLLLIVDIIIIGFAISSEVLIYDMLSDWLILQTLAFVSILILCLIQIKKTRHICLDQVAFAAVFLAFVLDIFKVGYNVYCAGIITKITLVSICVIYLFLGVRRITIEHQASVNNEKLRKELENSRIELMLSQIQPHFLYNSLTSVMDLCDRDPRQAKQAIADFADYLRGNLSSITKEKEIPFLMELEHIKKYLRLEKLRFEDELEIKYEIQIEDFMVPALSVQPLVENGVKHGLGQKSGGGTITISSFETQNHYVIQVTDDGIGFIEGEYADDKGTHIGLDNIKKRLEMMHAKLIIESKKGEGTKASILIAKRGE